MAQAELNQMLKSIGLPVAYHSFKTAPDPPYLVYLFGYSGDLMADNRNYVDISNFQVELYTIKKDSIVEELVQDKFKATGLTYTKIETFIEDEGLFQVLYLFQIIGG